ncbi:MAG: hypothetical protein JWM76_819 [Pseudonocardiales bacterium]|nr:hypothetical protein [Pseudonocardiales bacterium]
MVQGSRPGRGQLQLADIGGWLFRWNATTMASALGEVESVESRCAVRSYRLDLIRPGQPVVLWITGAARATPRPGVWMVGYTTGEVVDDPAEELGGSKRALVMLTDVTRLPTPLARADIATDPLTASMEILRQPFGANPSYLSPGEQMALQQLIGGWPD